ncbi:hypothetical protein ACP4OV_018286 [Aristida adscensionis]
MDLRGRRDARGWWSRACRRAPTAAGTRSKSPSPSPSPSPSRSRIARAPIHMAIKGVAAPAIAVVVVVVVVKAMAFEEALQVAARWEACEAEEAEIMRLVMLATAQNLASGKMSPEDPELGPLAARLEATALDVARRTAAPALEEFQQTAAGYAGTPGGEPFAAALRARAATAAKLRARAEEFAAFMRRLASMHAAAAAAAAAARRPAARPRRRNAKYFGPEWCN